MSAQPATKAGIFPQTAYGIAVVALFSLLALGLGVFALRMNPKEGIVPEGSLLEASGNLAGIKEYKYGIRFGLIGIDEKFDYSDKAGDVPGVRAALEGVSVQTVTVRYEPETHSAMGSKYVYHNVWALSVGSRKIRTYGEIAAAWEKDNQSGPWVGLVSTGCGLILGYVAWQGFRRRRRLG